jgi:hypothetical protein
MAKIVRRTWTSQGPAGKKVRHVAYGYTLMVDGKRERKHSVAGLAAGFVTLTVLAIVLTILVSPSWSQPPPTRETRKEEIQKQAEKEVQQFVKDLQERQAAAAADRELCAKSKDPAVCEMLAQRLRGIEATLIRIGSRSGWVLWETVLYGPDIALPGPSINPVAEFTSLDTCEMERGTAQGKQMTGRIESGGKLDEYPYVFYDCHPRTVDPRLAPQSPHESRRRR